MAVNNKRLSVTELDFDDIKTNLKVFLKAQDYLGFNANMAANEMF